MSTVNAAAVLKKDPKIGHDAITLTYHDTNKNIEAKITPYFGSNIYQFTYNNENIFYCDYDLLKDRDWTGCFVLWPFPNRIRDKQYTFDGKTYSLKGIKRKRGNYPLIHGLVDDQKWEVTNITHDIRSAKATTSIAITPNSPLYRYFPFSSQLTLNYLLDTSGLRVEYTIENKATTRMPFGFALHPYFSLISGRRQTFVHLPAYSVMEADKDLLPTGNLIDVSTTDYDLNKPLSVLQLQLDHVFTHLDRLHSPSIDYTTKRMKIYLESSNDFTHMVLYTLEEPFICFENQTGSTDMINLHERAVAQHDKVLERAAHLLILPAGKRHTGFIHYRIRQY